MKRLTFYLLLTLFGLLPLSAWSQTVNILVNTPISCNGSTDGALQANPVGFSGTVTYAWNTSPVQTTPIATGLGAGTYTVTVIDSFSTVMSSFTLLEPAPLLLGSQKTNEVCNGVGDGQVVLSASGGTGPYQYRQGATGAFQSGNTFPNLAPGNYTFTVEDANGCQAATPNISIAPSSNTALSLTTQSTSETCPGLNDGTLTLNASGGTPPYAYALDGGSFTPFSSTVTITQGPGNYAITVQDANGCSLSRAENIAAATAISINATIPLSATCGANDGGLYVFISGGTGPYIYELKDTTTNTTIASSTSSSTFFTFSNLAADDYQLLVSGTHNCPPVSADVTVAQQSPLQAILTSVTGSSCSAPTGSIAVTATGGASPFVYELFPTGSNTADATISSPNPSAQFSALAPGTYYLKVTDNNGCFVTTQDTSVLSTSNVLTTVAPSCAGANDGSIQVTATGVAPFSYQLFSSGGGSPLNTINSSNPSEQFSNLPAGTYSVTVSDNLGCSSNSGILAVTTVSVSITTFNLINNPCKGNSAGSVSFAVSGGNAPFTYALQGPSTVSPTTSNDSTATFSGLLEGLYSLTVTEGNGCQATSTASLTDPDSLRISSIVAQASACVGPTGSLQITSTGGTPSYAFTLSPVQGTLAGNTFQGLAAGNYQINVSDSKGCVATQNATVPAQTSPTFTYAPIPANCFGESNGEVQFTATSGVSPFNFRFMGLGVDTLLPPTAVNLGLNLNNLSAGTYTLKVTDQAGCNADTLVEISQPDQLVSGLDLPNSLLALPCYQGNNGQISLLNSGGTAPFQPYQLFEETNLGFTLVGSSAQATFPGLGEGSYRIVTTDANSCTDTLEIVLTQPGPDIVAYLPVDTGMCNQQDVLAFRGIGKYATAVFADTGMVPLPIDPNLGAYLLTPDTNVTYFELLINGSYPSANPLTGTNDLCFYDTTIQIRIHQRPEVAFVNTPAFPLDSLYCQNSTEEEIIIAQVSQANATILSRQLSGIGVTTIGTNESFNSDTALFLPSVLGIGGGTIRYSVEDTFGCRQSATQKVFVLPNPQVSMLIDSTCENTEAEFRIVSSFDPAYSDSVLQNHFGDPSLQYTRLVDQAQWKVLGIPIDTADVVTNTFRIPGQVIVSVQDFTNLAGCTTQTDSILEVGALPQPQFTWRNACLGDSTVFTDLTPPLAGVQGDSLDTWHWVFGDGSDSLLQSIAQIKHLYGAVNPSYPVELTIISSLNCVGSSHQKVYILDTVTVKPFAPYVQDFEENNAQWVGVDQGDSTRLWQWDMGRGAWQTTLYSFNVDAFLFTSCFDLGPLARPTLILDKQSQTETNDGTVLQYLDIQSETEVWRTLGSINAQDIASGVNWYNSDGIFGRPGGQGLGWEGTDSAVFEARHKLESVPARVRFRFAFGSDDRNTDPTGLDNGFALDRFVIQERDRLSALEVFSNQESPLNEYARYLQRENRGDVLVFQYAEQGEFFEDNPAPPRARSLYYGISRPRQAVLDGAAYNAGIFQLDSTSIDLRVLQAADFVITRETTATDTFLQLRAKQSFESEVVASVMVVEQIDGLYVVRKMLPDPGGYSYPQWLDTTQTERIDPQWDGSANPKPADLDIRDYDSLSVIVLVQEQASKEMLQAAIFPIWKDLLDPADLAPRQAAPVRPLGWKVYPNPTTGRLDLELPEAAPKGSRITLHDMQGRVVFQSALSPGAERAVLDLGGLGSGVYQLIVSGVGASVLQERVVVH